MIVSTKDNFNSQDIDYLKKELNAKNIAFYSELGTLIAARAKNYFNKWYDTNTNVYYDNIRTDYIKEYTNDEYIFTIYEEYIELCETGCQPLILSWYYVTKSNKDTEEEKDSIYLY
nr:MAG TPA: hypothetical protein [Caudoviricetes sp.]